MRQTERDGLLVLTSVWFVVQTSSPYPKVDLVSETLKELTQRRLAEIGRQRGGGLQTLLGAWQELPEGDDGKRPISYETARRVAEGLHTNIGDKTADALATMLGVHADDVLLAAGKRVRLGRFTLPVRADRLDRKERKVVLAVVDAILDAAEREAGTGDVANAAQKIGDQPGVETVEGEFVDVDTPTTTQQPEEEGES